MICQPRLSAVSATAEIALTPWGLCGAADDGADGSLNYLTIRETTADPFAIDVLADSMGGWSVTGTQGDNGWLYGYYDVKVDVETGDGVYAADEFTEFLNDGSNTIVSDDTIGAWKDAVNHWDGNAWDMQINYWDPDPAVTGDEYGHGPWTGIGCSTTHPAGTSVIRLPKRSMCTIQPSRASASRITGTACGSMTGSSILRPIRSGGIPLERWAATGAKISRP